MFQEHQQVVLLVDLPEHHLKAGEIGTIVHVYPNGAAYEVEFSAHIRRPTEVVTIEKGQIRPLKP